MAKTKISEFSTTPGNNTDINGINISEGCAPSGINNAIRELMSDLKEWQSGAMDVYVIPQGTAAAPGIQLYGDLDTGFYGDAANQLGVAVGGSSVGYFSASGWVGNVVAQTIDLVNIEVTNIKAKDGTTSISLADSTGIATFSKATVIETTDNTNAALRITQLGTGNALLVEDATNPDTTPTVIDQFGNVILGTTARTTPVTSKIEIHGTASELSGLSPSLGFYHWSATASLSSTLTFRHYPSGTVGTLAANTLGDVLGRVVFLSYDGTNAFGASIRGVSGAGGTAPSITYDASGGHNFTSGPIDVENLEVTNIKARDGTAAASIADSTGAITVTKDLTANGVTLGKGLGSVLTNTALGRSALAANTVGDLNTAVGNLSLTSNTGGTGNTAVGHVAMTSHQGGSLNTAVGAGSLTANLNGNNNTAIGQSALGTATGSNNTAVGSAAGSLITNGNKNTIIGNYDGNQGGLDIRTASNYIVLSDGDGNPRAYWNGANATFGGTLTATTITGTQVNSDNLRLDGNTLSSTDTNGNIVVAPNGTGITTFSNYLKTGNLEVGQAALGTNFITATDTNGGIYLQTNGTGLIFADAASIIAGNASATTKITTNGASDLVLDTNDGSNSGSITIQDGVNGNIVIAPNGTGQVQITNAALDLTTIEVTNIKAKDGTAALSIADSTGVVSVSANPVLSGGTANGVVYLNASKAATSGAALTFDGTTLGNTGGIVAGGSSPFYGSAGRGNVTSRGTSSAIFALGVNGVEAGYLFGTGSVVTLGAPTGVPITFDINGEKMRLTSGGQLNLGGNFTSTNNTLQVTGNAAIGYTTAAPTTGLIVAGNVGVGTDSPATSARLHVYATGDYTDEAAPFTLGNSATGGVRLYAGVNNTNDYSYIGSVKSGTRYNNLVLQPNGGNLGLGVTPSAWRSTWKAFQISNRSLAQTGAGAGDLTMVFNGYFDSTDNRWEFQGAGDYAARYSITGAGVHSWHISTAAGANANDPISFTQAMTLDASGNLGIGETNPAESLEIKRSGATSVGIVLNQTGTSGRKYVIGSTSTGYGSAGNLIFYDATASAERARITSGGDFRVKGAGTAGSTDAFQISGSAPADAARLTSGGDLLVGTTTNTTYGGSVFSKNGTNANVLAILNTATSLPYGPQIEFTAAAPNDATRYFVQCRDTGGERASIRSNGGLANYQSNNVDLSDIRTKTDINPLASYWNKIAALEIVSYKYKDQTHDDLNIGVIAQQVEQVAPEFVDADGFGETPEDGVPLKTIYNKDLTFAAIKALQEAMARIEKLEAEVAALKGV